MSDFEGNEGTEDMHELNDLYEVIAELQQELETVKTAQALADRRLDKLAGFVGGNSALIL